MTFARPALRFDFANNPRWIDPRATFIRSGAGTYVDSLGIRRTAPSNAPRFECNPVTGKSLGLLFETTRTNQFLQSRSLENAAWTANQMAVTANLGAAQDGTLALERLAATGTGAYVLQYCTITAGTIVTVSFYARALTSIFIKVVVGDLATSQVAQWFNIGNGVVASRTSVNGGTVTFLFSDVEDCGGGLYRCSVTCSTATSTSIYGAIVPVTTDLVEPVPGDSVYAGDAQFESSGQSAQHATSFIATTAATVTRNADALILPLTGPWWRATEGTIVFDWLQNRRTAPTLEVFGGFGDTFSNTLYISKAPGLMYTTIISGGGTGILINRPVDYTVGVRTRLAISWKTGSTRMVSNGGAANGSFPVLPVSPVRLLIGGAPYGATGGTACNVPISTFDYYAEQLTDAQMASLTTPT